MFPVEEVCHTYTFYSSKEGWNIQLLDAMA
jgi:hypothetical protein